MYAMEKLIIISICSFLLFSGCNNIEKQNVAKTSNSKIDSIDQIHLDKNDEVGLKMYTGFRCTPCNIDAVAKFENNFNNLNEKLITEFLCTFDSLCKMNIEYSEYSNEMLFRFLNKYPDLYLTNIVNEHLLKNQAYIFQVLSEPVSDEFDVDSLIDKIANCQVEGYDEVKMKTIKAVGGIPVVTNNIQE